MMSIKELHRGLDQIGRVVTMDFLYEHTPEQLVRLEAFVSAELKRRSESAIEYSKLLSDFRKENNK